MEMQKGLVRIIILSLCMMLLHDKAEKSSLIISICYLMNV